MEQLTLYIKQEWERISLSKLRQLVSSVPKRLLTKLSLSKLFWNILQASNSEFVYIYKRTLMFISLFFVQLSIGHEEFANHCILFLF